MADAENPPVVEEETTPAAPAEDTSEDPKEETPEGASEEPTKGDAEDTPEGDAEEAPAGEEEPTEDTPPEDLPADLSDFVTEFTDTGALTDESFAALAEKGYSRDVVEAYIRGVTFTLDDAAADALIDEVGGGADAYKEMTDWASENLSKDEVSLFNSALASKDTARMAIEWLKVRHGSVEGNDPVVTLSGDPGADSTPAVEGYANRQEMSKDMRDKRYKSDPEFARMVEKRVAKSTFL